MEKTARSQQRLYKRLRKKIKRAARQRISKPLELMMELTILLGVGNSLILAVLLFMYSKIALKTRSAYPGGLVVFAFLLLLQNLLMVFSYALMAPFFGVEALPYLLGTSALEFGSLLVLIKTTV
jgi:hypothetical protein